MPDDRLTPDPERAALLAFLRAGGMPLIYVARDGTILHANDAGVRNTGLPAEQVLGHSLYEVVPGMAAPFRERIARVFETSQPMVVEDEIAVPGGPRLFRSVLDPVFDAAGAVMAVQCYAWDVTAERTTADSLRRADQKLSVILAHSPYIILMFSRGGIVSYINHVGPGFTLEEVIGSDAHAFVAPEHHGTYDEALRRVFEEALTAKFEFNDVHGTWWEATMVPVVHEGRVEHGLSFSVDITERRRAAAKQARLQQQMQHAQKLESLGVLAGGVAHDFNNLLLIIMANTQLAMRRNSPPDPVLKDVMRASERAAELCRQMLGYAGRGQLAVEHLDLSRLVADMVDLLRVSVSKAVALRTELPEDLPAIEADPTQLRQIVLNLITNASDSIGDRPGVISVRTRREELGSDDVRASYASHPIEPGEYVTLEVQDTGSGMDELTRSRMFDPFFSTKGSGRGLGLAATLGVMGSHRGAVFVTSERDVGTTICVSFPAAKGAVRPREVRGRRPNALGHGTVLVADDEAGVRRVAERALTQGGYDVVLTEHGEACLARYDEMPGRIRLVLLDLTMPVLDGARTLAALRERAPTLPVVIMSGYAESAPRDRYSRFLRKPFSVDELLEVVREALGRDASAG